MTDTGYTDWIVDNVDPRTLGYGKCQELCEDMADAFPELSIRKGMFESIAWGPRTHWWLRDEDGEIIDPAGRQHPDGAWFPVNQDAYFDTTDMTEDEAIATGRVPTGKCMNCGETTYGKDGSMCGDKCAKSYVAYLNGGGL